MRHSGEMPTNQNSTLSKFINIAFVLAKSCHGNTAGEALSTFSSPGDHFGDSQRDKTCDLLNSRSLSASFDKLPASSHCSESVWSMAEPEPPEWWRGLEMVNRVTTNIAARISMGKTFDFSWSISLIGVYLSLLRSAGISQTWAASCSRRQKMQLRGRK